MRNSPVLGNSTLLRRTSLLAAAALTTLALAACGSDDLTNVADDPAADPTTAAPTTSAPTEPTETPTTTTSAPAESSSPISADTLITLDAPADGATVSGSFDASGTANSPEANVPWRILDGSGKKVLHGHFTAEGWMDKLYPYAGTVNVSKLPAGSYTFEVAVDDPSGGEGKPPQKVDRAITVQ
ncbi:Gmad2 immunoglobulin-like domain-containing protein [Nocardioides sp. CER19]|uniref:Gmad2 immunoglobulin-like domain-containing protein n=1 Tax=Nocardioides sp. CER19 TaxID=3038538 RepID=UPI00244B5260|nr:Gmad2 immunoglobulin-like domain-containing protein [Nocardioides sp. CER19]MDH2415505.1 Gmad2 immunoglobulin-like domain-containing protein [Nocardioides sp. CER19]